MQLEDSFTLPVSVDSLWEVLTDVELIAPCVPGFKLEEAADPDYRGAMTVKVGAVTVAYNATITFAERDDHAKRTVLKVSARERRGGGRADATVTATLSGDDTQATADMVTDVQITGRVAQFGRGIIGDVAAQLTRQFVDDLNAKVLVPREQPTSAAAVAAADQAPPAPVTAEDVEPLDLNATAAGPILKRAAPALLVALSLGCLAWFARRR